METGDFPYSLYLIIDPHLCGANPLTLVETGIKNGVDIIQLRYKGEDMAYFHNLAKEFREVTRKLNTPLIINDRVDICLAVDADGVHLGQSDCPVEAAREILGQEKIVGLSTHNLQQAQKAHQMPVDYIGLGPVFTTSSKNNPDPVIGPDNLGNILATVRLPCFAIGGISSDNIAGVVKAGGRRIALITAITRAEDAAGATRLLKNALSRK